MADKPRNGTPRWLSYLVLGFILYAGYLHFNSRIAEKNLSQSAVSTAVSKQADTVTAITPGVSIGGEIAGSGEPASCGQTATLDVSGKKSDGSDLGVTAAGVIVAVGAPADGMPWAPAVPGMKAGGVREVVLLAQQAFGDYAAHGLKKDERVRYKLDLKALTPTAPLGTLPFRASELAFGQGAMAQCGDKVKVQIDTWKEDGSKAFSTSENNGAPIEMTIGASENFYGLDRGLINMQVGSLRALTLPPALLAASPGARTDPRLAALPRDQVLLMDVKLVELAKAKK